MIKTQAWELEKETKKRYKPLELNSYEDFQTFVKKLYDVHCEK